MANLQGPLRAFAIQQPKGPLGDPIMKEASGSGAAPEKPRMVDQPLGHHKTTAGTNFATKPEPSMGGRTTGNFNERTQANERQSETTRAGPQRVNIADIDEAHDF